ncbi:MAG: ADP-ribosylglycohydrolase family protein [Elusimicrobiota bacterium]
MSSQTASFEDRAAGAMLGLALGDALGAPHEGGPLERAFWLLLGLPHGRLLRWTDDTQMAAAAAESLIRRGGLDPDDLARRWAADARFLRGYGAGTWKWVRRVRAGQDRRTAALSAFPNGSFGNGGAMRAAPIGVFFRDRPAELEAAAAAAAAVTHAHPLGVEGGVLIALAAAAAMETSFTPAAFLRGLLARGRREEFRSRLDWAASALDSSPSPEQARRRLGNGVAAHESVVTAVYSFARHHDDFSAMMEFILAVGGDTDTIGAMAGGLFGARNGVEGLPGTLLARLEQRERLESLGRELERRARA